MRNFVVQTLFKLLLFCLVKGSFSQLDECQNYTELSSAERSRYYLKYEPSKCDAQNWTTGWYRFTGAAGSQIATSCVSPWRCGRILPGWMNGSHPTTAEGVVIRNVCFTYQAQCCSWRTTINVKNCGSYFIYKLFQSPHCEYRYCGNGTGVHDCSSNLCRNGTCQNTNDGYVCKCPQGYEGRNCEPLDVCQNYAELDSADRSRYYNASKSSFCDGFDLDVGWYRFTGAAGSNIATSCVPYRHCGTYLPGWMNGSHPTIADGIVSRQVCYGHDCYHDGRGSCYYKNMIRVKNCSSFFVYELGKTPTCHMRYCAQYETDLKCNIKPCRNGGTCQDTNHGYHCYCPREYIGRHCESLDLSGSVYTWDHFVALVEKIERHKLTGNKPLKVIANYIRKLSYDDHKWTTLLGPQLDLPDDILAPTEKAILTKMVSHRFSGQQELGVVHTPFGDVAMGHVILGICAGISRNKNLQLPHIPSKIADNLHLATIAGELGLTTLVKKLNPSLPLLGPGSTWSPNTKCPETLSANSRSHSKATDAQILGGIDGFLLGSKIPEWSSRGVRLGQLLRMYYQGGVVYDKKYSACRRLNTFNNIDGVNKDFSEQVALSAYAVKDVWNNTLGLAYHNVPDKDIPALANSSIHQFYTYANNLQSRYSSCYKGIQDDGCSLSANIVFVLDESGSIGAQNYEVEKDFVQKVIGAFDISPYSVRVAVVEYSNSAYESIKLGEYSSKAPLVCAVGKLGFAGGGTETSRALQKAFGVLKDAQSQSGSVHRSDPQIMILLTDGHSYGGISRLRPIVENIKKSIKGLTMVAVGVGGYNKAELELIATDPNKHVLTTSDFSKLILLVKLLRTETCETATVLEPNLTPDKTKTTYNVKITLYVGPGKTRYFKIASATLIKTENLTIQINASYGTVTVYLSRTDPTPGPDSYDFKYQVSGDQNKTSNGDDGKLLVFNKLCKAYMAYNRTCPPLYIGVVGQNSSNACSDRDCSVPNQIKVKIKAVYSGHCMSSPCNNGTCHATTNSFYCTCHSGYSGRNCLGCSGRPCRNGGTCRQSYYGYRCQCQPGYSGQHCESAYGYCVSRPCYNGGTCYNTRYWYYCSCPYGYTGSQCQISIGCIGSPCRNGGTCQYTYYGYRCQCPHGYSGQHCETNLKTKVKCDPRYMEVELTRSYFTHLDYRNLHLNDPSCRATQVTSSFIRLRTRLNGCGTNHTERSNNLEFWNQVKADNLYLNPNQSIITRDDHTLLRFHCKFSRRQLVSTSFSPSKHTVHVSEGNFGNFTFTMNLFKSADYKNMYLPFEYPVVVSINQPLWIEFRVTDTISDLVVFADNCHATTSTNPNSYPQYEFLRSGCALDSTMAYNYDQNSSVQQFSIKSFRFIHANNKLVYLHCELMVCHRNSDKSRCSRGCVRSRRRREADDYKDTSDTYGLSVGPFHGNGNYHGNSKATDDAMETNVAMATSLGVVGGLLLLVSALFIAFKIKARRTAQPAGPVTVNCYENASPADIEEKTESCEMQAKI